MKRKQKKYQPMSEAELAMKFLNWCMWWMAFWLLFGVPLLSIISRVLQ